MKSLLIGAVIAVAFASPSLAEKLTLTFSGTLTSGDDNTGVFGTNTDLAGESVSVQFFIDTTLGTRTEANSQLQYIGGFFYPVQTSPVTSGTITVAGVTHIVDFPAFGDLLELIPPGVLGDDIEAQVSQLPENQTGPVLHFDSISAFSQSNLERPAHAERLRHAVQLRPERRRLVGQWHFLDLCTQHRDRRHNRGCRGRLQAVAGHAVD